MKNKKLITTGVYALVRNPIYSAFMLFCTGALLISGNLLFTAMVRFVVRGGASDFVRENTLASGGTYCD